MARIISSFEPTERDNTKTLVVFAAIIAGLYFGSEILVPIALAILLSFVLAPTVRLLHKLGLGRLIPVGITVILAFAIIATLCGLIASQLKDLSANLPQYEATMVRKIQYMKGMSNGGEIQRIEDAIAKLSKALNRATPAGKPASDDATPGPHASTVDAPASPPITVQVVQPTPGSLETLSGVLAPLLHPLATAFIVVIFVVFILLQREDMRNRAIRLFGASDLQRTTAAIDDGAKRLSRYLLTQCAVNATSGTIVGVALWLLGVPSPVLLGILFACLRFIPYVGPIIGAMLPTLLAAAVDPGWTMVIWTVVVLLGVEIIIGQVVEPLAYGHNTGLSPLAIIIAATFWTVLWGPVGLLLSTPLTVCLVVLGRHVEHLEFLDVLLGDRPPLQPSETFYQRMLANDPIEAADQAHKCLEEMSVSNYYDDIAVPGLLLAQDDVRQNRLNAARQNQIKDAALDVIDDLEHDGPDEEHSKARRAFWRLGKAGADKDKGPPQAAPLPEATPERYRATGSVLCIGARGPLDDAAAAMLSEVFRGHDVGARWESFATLSKSAIEELSVEGVSLICLSALDGSSPAFLRFALRRLRRRAPKAQLLVGAWWRRDGLTDLDQEIDEAISEPKVTTFVDAVGFVMAQSESTKGEQSPPQSPAHPQPALAAV